MAIRRGDSTNSVSLDEERRKTSLQEVKTSIDDDVNARIKRESARVEPEEEAELVGVARELKQHSIHEAAETERDLSRSRTVARVSQIVDYFFYLIYGLIALQFMLRLMGARPGNGFVQFIAGLTWPLLGPFAGIVPTPSSGAYRFEFSYLLALVVYILIHFAVNGLLRLIAHRKVTI